jgi:hypothetical protein
MDYPDLRSGLDIVAIYHFADATIGREASITKVLPVRSSYRSGALTVLARTFGGSHTTISRLR